MSQSKPIKALQERIGYSFQNAALLERALTHSSFGDGKGGKPDNERLEFLGDRVLGLLTAQRVFESSDGAEGELARRLNSLVRKEACARVAQRIELGGALIMSKAEERQGGREKTSILGDAMEALLGALYCDGGFDAANVFYDKFWAEELAGLSKSSHKDPKTRLQEEAASRSGGQPIYQVTQRKGPDHRPNFTVRVTVDKLGQADGDGPSKKQAEREAAGQLLKELGIL